LTFIVLILVYLVQCKNCSPSCQQKVSYEESWALFILDNVSACCVTHSMDDTVMCLEAFNVV
jgi:hypothetical protein